MVTNMIEKLIGEAMKILNVKYNVEQLQFMVECVMPGQTVASIYPFHRDYFPQHTSFNLLDEKVQVGEIVHVWLKEESLLKNEGWKDLTKHTLSSSDSPFKIGKGKKPYLGGAHKATVCVDSKFRTFVKIKDYRFSPLEIKCVLKLDMIFQGKSATLDTELGIFSYDANGKTLSLPNGYRFDGATLTSMIDLLRRAKLV